MENGGIEPSRRALLQYFNTQTMTHGGYIIALVIGSTTLISNWRAFSSSLGIWRFFLLLNSLLIVASLFVLLRTLFWGYLASGVIEATPSEDKNTIMMRVYLGSLDRIKKNHGFIYNFRSLQRIEVITFLIGAWSIMVLWQYFYA
jgi:hypothetical protein